MNNTNNYKHIWSVTNDYIYSKSSSTSKVNAIINYFKALSLDELKSIGIELSRNQNASHKIPFKYLLDLARKAYAETINAEKIVALDLTVDKSEDRSVNAEENLKKSVDGSKAHPLDLNPNFAFINTYNNVLNLENKTNTIGVPQNQNSTHIVPQILDEDASFVPQNEELFGVNNDLFVPQIDIDKIIDAFVPHKKQALVHKCILDLNIPEDKIRNKMIAFMRHISRMIDSIEEKLYEGKEIEYVEISSDAFDLVDEHDHKWIKQYLAQFGIKPRSHSYSVQQGKCIKYYIDDIQLISEMDLIDVDNKLQKEIKRFEKKRLKRKIQKMNAYEKLALLGSSFLWKFLPPIELVRSKKDSSEEFSEDNIKRFEKIAKFGISMPSMGYWHRCYSRAQGLPKAIRALTGLQEVDTKAMQINLLLYLAYKDGYLTEEQYEMYSGDVYTNLFPEMERKDSKSQVCEVYLSCPLDRMQACEVYELIRQKIGILNWYSENYKKVDGVETSESYKNLSRRLTQLEATLIFTAMSRAWQQGIECFYLYDALLVLPENAHRMKEIMDGVFTEYGVRTWAEVKQAA